MAQLPKHSVSVAGIVISDDRALAIQRRDNGHWEPPGGVLELDESPLDGVAREVLEETGVEVNVGPLTGLYKNLQRGIVALVFRCEMIGGSPRPTAESVAVEWLDRHEILERATPAYACRFLDAFSHTTPGPAIRTHDGHQLIARR